MSGCQIWEEGVVGESMHPCELDPWERRNGAPGQSHFRAKTAQTDHTSRRRELCEYTCCLSLTENRGALSVPLFILSVVSLATVSAAKTVGTSSRGS